MGMDYRYSGSSTYLRFGEEMNIIDELVNSDDVIFVSWIADPYKQLSLENTKHIYKIISDFMDNNPDVELPYQIINELEESISYGEGWWVY